METQEIFCENCSKQFFVKKYTIVYRNGTSITRFPTAKYCSKKCYARQNYLKHRVYYQNYWLTRPNLFAWKKPRICFVCKVSYMPKTANGETCSRKCTRKKWKILNPEKNRENNRLSTKRCRKRDPERYRFYVKNRRHRLRVASNGLTDRGFTEAFTLKDWEDIKSRFNNSCVLCGKSDLKLTIDHIIPISKGGLHIKENIQPLCAPCNSGKKDKILVFSDNAAYSS